MRRILTSVFVIALLAAAVLGATRAFFSDTETSTGNTFAAGDIDLQIDNTSYAIDWNIPGYKNPTGAFVASNHTWEMKDLTIEKFFDFVDLKPGDYGEDTISVHVGSNDAWVCAAARITADNDNTYTEPETADDQTVGQNPTATDGELDEGLNFVFWIDDGDNVLEFCNEEEDVDCVDEREKVFLQGTLADMGKAGQIALADSNSSIIGQGKPIPGGATFYIGKYWCFGKIEFAPVAQGNNSPLKNTGFTCDGAGVDNAAQTDVIVGDLQFYAQQARHNPKFLCRNWKPAWSTQPNG